MSHKKIWCKDNMNKRDIRIGWELITEGVKNIFGKGHTYIPADGTRSPRGIILKHNMLSDLAHNIADEKDPSIKYKLQLFSEGFKIYLKETTVLAIVGATEYLGKGSARLQAEEWANKLWGAGAELEDVLPHLSYAQIYGIRDILNGYPYIQADKSPISKYLAEKQKNEEIKLTFPGYEVAKNRVPQEGYSESTPGEFEETVTVKAHERTSGPVKSNLDKEELKI